MSGIQEMFKKVPVPIWIGLGLVLIVILLMNRGGSKGTQQAPTTTAMAGPVTTATVGTQGSQAGAGTDQELGNLSVITQSGFAQLNSQLQNNVQNGMSGVGPMHQQFGGSMQWIRNTSAANNAANGSNGQNAGSNPTFLDTGLPPTPAGGVFQAGG